MNLQSGICLGFAAALFGLTGVASTGHTESPTAVISPVPLPRISPGTVIDTGKMQNYTDLILFVRGHLTAGDTEAVNETVRYYGALFNLVYLAKVSQVPEKGYVLDQVAVGFATKINDNQVVISAATEGNLGAGLNFIGRQVLAGNEKSLEEVQLVAKNDYSALIDAPAMLYRDDTHKPMNVRFFVWVSPDGKVGTCDWLLDKNNGQLSFADDTFNYLPPKMKEDRILHVDGSKFTLGIPSAEAFALTKIPQGRAYPATPELKKAAAQTTYTHEAFSNLALLLSENMSNAAK